MKNSKPDLSVLKEYKKREAEFMNRAKDLEEVSQQRDAQKQKYDGLRKQRLDEFMAGFNLISLKLKEMYQVRSIGLRENARQTRLFSDDHPRRECRVGTGRQHGPLLGGHYIQCHASKEELEEHFKSFRRRKGNKGFIQEKSKPDMMLLLDT